MIAQSDDDRINDAINHLRSAMSLLNEAGARLSAAHVATAIFCIPSVGRTPDDGGRAVRDRADEPALWQGAS